MEEKRLAMIEKYIKERLPKPEQSRTIFFIDNVPITWLSMLEEFKRGGNLSDKIEKKFMEMLQ